MDIYARKSQWKWYLAAGGVIIIIVSLLYTKYLADRLAEREYQQARQFGAAVGYIAKMQQDSLSNQTDLSLNLLIMENNTTIPVVVLNELGQIEEARNIEGESLEDPKGSGNYPVPMDTARIRQALNRLIRDGADTIPIVIPPDISKTLIYTNSYLLALLNWYPYVQLFLIAVFIGFGYMGFSASRRAEENQVWLGMAKETAHQLGTPISAIMGWVETLRSVNEDNEVNLEMLGELTNDVHRLELVADRFSKIGSQPELRAVNFYEELEKCRNYMQRRAPRRTAFDFPNPAEHPRCRS
jgi:signal transduction histidine kinase